MDRWLWIDVVNVCGICVKGGFELLGKIRI